MCLNAFSFVYAWFLYTNTVQKHISEMYFQARIRILNSFKGKAGVGGDSIQKKEGGWGIDSKFDEKFNVRVI